MHGCSIITFSLVVITDFKNLGSRMLAVRFTNIPLYSVIRDDYTIDGLFSKRLKCSLMSHRMASVVVVTEGYRCIHLILQSIALLSL